MAFLSYKLFFYVKQFPFIFLLFKFFRRQGCTKCIAHGTGGTTHLHGKVPFEPCSGIMLWSALRLKDFSPLPLSLHLHHCWLHTSEERVAKPTRQLSISARFSIHLSVYKFREKENKNKKKIPPKLRHCNLSCRPLSSETGTIPIGFRYFPKKENKPIVLT